MEYVKLGSTGLTVSKLCLGTMTFGFQIDESESEAILDRADSFGIDFIDTADVYPLGGSLETVGRTEEIVGRWLKGRRDNYVVASKCSGQMGPRPNDQGNSRRHILSAVEGSLRRLGTDYIDLYQLHRYDDETPIEETMLALDDLVKSGKVRYIGASNFLAYQLARAQGIASALSISKFATIQPRYNLLFREFERELFPLCDLDGIGVIPFNPLAGGMLTGKHNVLADPPADSRFSLGSAASVYQARYWNQIAASAVEEIVLIAKSLEVSPATLSLAWVLANKTITAPIIGASKATQIDDMVAALDLKLSDDVYSQLNELTHHFRFGDAAR